MASDRRFGLPHPLDAEFSEGSASRRKAGLWETLRRALGAPTPLAPNADPPHQGEATGTLRPPASPPTSPAAPPPTPRRPEPVVPALPLASLPAEEVPFLEDPAVPALSESAAATPHPASPPDETPAPTPVPPDSTEPPARPSRLARGLASFSSDNAEREKKFAHLLRDAPPGARRRADRPRKRG